MRFGGQRLAQRWATAWAGVLPRSEVTGAEGQSCRRGDRGGGEEVTVDGAPGVGKVRRSHALANPMHSLGRRWWPARTVSMSPAEASTHPTTPR
jgi:hypothetical protein